MVWPDRRTSTWSTVPAGCEVIIEVSEVSPVTGWPFTAVMTSPFLSDLLAG